MGRSDPSLSDTRRRLEFPRESAPPLRRCWPGTALTGFGIGLFHVPEGRQGGKRFSSPGGYYRRALGWAMA